MMSSLYRYAVWLVALMAVVMLWRLRGTRGIMLLLGCLLVVLVAVIVANIIISSHLTN